MQHLLRQFDASLLAWRHKTQRLPLVLWGPRQVGKSTSVEHFGKNHFHKCLTFNFQKNPSLHALFEADLDPRKILRGLESISQSKITSNDLLFFDEVQECAGAITALKYFSEDCPQQALIAAGSYLGLFKNEASFPVGKVDFLSMHPMTFFEFLKAVDEATLEEIKSTPHDFDQPVPRFYHERALRWLRIYFATGGLPECVRTFATSFSIDGISELEALRLVREVQERLIEGYRSDFAKHAGVVNANHILRVFDSTAIQLGQAQDSEVKRFRFSQVIPKKKGFEDIDGPMTWLEKARLVIKTHVANQLAHPLKAHTKQNYFKTYLFDIGILHTMLQIPIEALLEEEIGQYKGYIAENFIAQEIFAATNRSPIGWSQGESEIEFIVTRGSHLCPLEVKASARARRSKSLEALIARYHPQRSYKLTGQNRGVNQKNGLVTLPLYMIQRIFEAK